MYELYELIAVFGVFLALLAAGMQVPFAISISALFYLILHGGFDALKGLGLTSWGSTNSFTLTAIPLFIFMAEILQKGGVSLRIYRGLAKLVSPLPGGLLQTNIAGCAVFASISGSSVATAAAIGTSALPQLTGRAYDRRMAAGSLAAGGTLGILMPPSIAMIVYGTFTETSIAKLFMAGVIPGLMLAGMFMTFVGIYAWIKPSIAPRESAPASIAEYRSALLDLVPFILLISGTMGSIYLGLATPTEAAAIGCAVALGIASLDGDLSWVALRQAMRGTVLICGNILFIILAAFLFSYAISLSGVGEQFTSYIAGLNLTRMEFFLAILLLYTVLGCLVESLGMIVITVPLLYPVLLQYGFDPIWFGVVLVVFIEMGQISPPLGINLFVIQSIWDGKLSDVVIGTIPFHLIMFLLLALLVLWPDIALWLPEQMMAKPG